jgi:diguanylate cyclase (GGDEF)-like protein
VIHDDRGQTLVLAANREITRRKKAERAVESANRKLKRALEREQMLARIDYLTGAFNRRQFFMAAEKAFAQARRYKRSLALMILDIDHFKNVNDSFGHQVGDQMLKRLTQLMKHELRAPDILARHGGEEFIALLPESNSTAAWAVAERIRQKIEGYNLVTSRGNVFVTVSIGVAEALPEVDSLDRLVAMADEAMYRAKQAGRNKTVVFEV